MSAFTGDYTSYAEAVGEGRTPYESHVFYPSEDGGYDEYDMEIIGMITAQDKLNREAWLESENASLRAEIARLRGDDDEPDNDYEDCYYD